MPLKCSWCAKDACTITCGCSGGKKILEWSASPHNALDTMIELNNKYALGDSFQALSAHAFSAILYSVSSNRKATELRQ